MFSRDLTQLFLRPRLEIVEVKFHAVPCLGVFLRRLSSDPLDLVLESPLHPGHHLLFFAALLLQVTGQPGEILPEPSLLFFHRPRQDDLAPFKLQVFLHQSLQVLPELHTQGVDANRASVVLLAQSSVVELHEACQLLPKLHRNALRRGLAKSLGTFVLDVVILGHTDDLLENRSLQSLHGCLELQRVVADFAVMSRSKLLHLIAQI
mmetsp:Transcript_49842/g.132315  ORF Transcript_49842/g.132315 Transcript_49842/m.132315 type:complete len:207 (+) Transcript_49842:4411-5031(+)